MPASTIYVNKNGSPCFGVKVMLSFSAGGVTPTNYTDGQGKAVITHDGTGTATIFVDGMKRGSFRAPGTATVER